MTAPQVYSPLQWLEIGETRLQCRVYPTRSEFFSTSFFGMVELVCLGPCCSGLLRSVTCRINFSYFHIYLTNSYITHSKYKLLLPWLVKNRFYKRLPNPAKKNTEINNDICYVYLSIYAKK